MYTIINRDRKTFLKEYGNTTVLREVTFHSVNSEVGLSVMGDEEGPYLLHVLSRDVLKNGTLLKKKTVLTKTEVFCILI